MNCASCHEHLIDALYGALDESTREAFDAHLATCEACRSEFAAMQAIVDHAHDEPGFGLLEAQREALMRAAAGAFEVGAHASTALSDSADGESTDASIVPLRPSNAKQQTSSSGVWVSIAVAAILVASVATYFTQFAVRSSRTPAPAELSATMEDTSSTGGEEHAPVMAVAAPMEADAAHAPEPASDILALAAEAPTVEHEAAVAPREESLGGAPRAAARAAGAPNRARADEMIAAPPRQEAGFNDAYVAPAGTGGARIADGAASGSGAMAARANTRGATLSPASTPSMVPAAAPATVAPNNSEARTTVAEAAVAQGTVAQGAVARTALQTDNAGADIALPAGLLHAEELERRGKIADALRAYSDVLDEHDRTGSLRAIPVKEETLRYHLGELYLRQGQTAEARSAFERYLTRYGANGRYADDARTQLQRLR